MKLALPRDGFRFAAPLFCWLFLAAAGAQTPAFRTVHQFGPVVMQGANPFGGLTAGSDGNFYGTTQNGGTNGTGTVFRITPAGEFTTMHNFRADGANSDGAHPLGKLLLYSDGSFYGTASGGGSNATGTVFKITPAGALTTLYTFQAKDSNSHNDSGAYPAAGLILASDGNFYGTAQYGGTHDIGTVFQLTPGGMLTTLYSFSGEFDGARRKNADGAYPDDVLVQGNDGNLYGMTPVGGQTASGTIFKVTPAGEFTLLDTNGYFGNALTKGSDGNFYGAGMFSIYRITPDGTYTTLYDLTGSESGRKYGAGPEAALALGSDGNFYGTTTRGGLHGTGTVFRITPTGVISTVCSFSATTFDNFNFTDYNADGLSASGALVQDGDGNFYGTCPYGGANGKGTVFKVTPNGVLTTLHDFADSNPDGAAPAAPFLRASDGNLYGTVEYGGAYGNGTVIRITPAGVTTTLHSFRYEDGAFPLAALIEGSDGNFYGTTSFGGDAGGGTVFKMTHAGVLTTLYAFNQNGGEIAANALAEAGDGFLYGTTSDFRFSPAGTAFKVSKTGTGFSTLHTFSHSDGLNPSGLTLGSDGKLYGTTQLGGTDDVGTIFRLTTAGNFATVYQFRKAGSGNHPYPDGGHPFASLIRAGDGTFYGTTRQGGTVGVSGFGTVFKFTANGVLTTLHSFSALNGGDNKDGAFPQAGVSVGADGNIYGATTQGGLNGTGTIYEITPAGAFTTLHSFGASADDGATPLAAPVQSADGNFYGTASAGGANGNGAIYELVFPPQITSPANAMAVVGKPFTYRITATGSPASFGAVGLFQGLKINAATGVISGTPTAAGTHTVTLKAANSAGAGTRLLTITMVDVPVITSPKTATATLGKPFSYQIRATNSPASYGVEGLPTGLKVDAKTGLISGIPTVSGTKTLTLKAGNSAGVGKETLTLTING